MTEVPYLPDLLAARAAAAATKPKRTRTRLAMLAAAAAEMAEVGYKDMTIDSIVRRAGLARGTFYLYFDNKADAAIAIRQAFTAVLRKIRPRGLSRLSAWEAVWQVNRLYVAFYARNGRIAAGVELLSRERPEVLAGRDRMNQRWAEVLLRDLRRRKPELAQDTRATLLGLRYVIMMADEVLRQTYTDPPEQLRALAVSEDEVTTVLSRLWFRAIYAEDIAESELEVHPAIAAGSD